MGREGRKMKGLLVMAMAMAESSTAFMSLSPSSCPAPPLLLPSSSSYMRPRARRQSFVMAESTGSRAEQKKEETDEVGTRSRRLVKMSLMLARLGGDLEALGRGGLDIDIERVEREIDSLYAKTCSKKEEDIASQMTMMSTSLREECRQGVAKLHLGCGKNVMPAEHDSPDCVISMNLATTPLPLDDGSCQYVYTSHMLEHLSHPVETSILMEEALRVLAPGGILRVVVPDAEKWMKSYVTRDASFLQAARQHWSHWDWRMFEQRESWLDFVLPYLGASSLKGALTGSHQFGFDETALRALLERAGFPQDSIERSSFQESRHSPLRVDDRGLAARATFEAQGSDDPYFSLFIEARKPERASSQPVKQQDNALQKVIKALLGAR